MKRLYIETYGCQMNIADSEVVAAVMKMAGYDVCENEKDADAVFLNTCSVRETRRRRSANVSMRFMPCTKKKADGLFSECSDAWRNA